MIHDPARRHRRSIRLRDYDYTQPGAHFVTICLHHRAPLFGDVIDGDVALSDAGLVVESWWHDLNRRFPTLATDAYVVMPDHLHGVVLLGARPANQGDHAGSPLPTAVPTPTPEVGAGRRACPAPPPRRSAEPTPAPPSLADVIAWFKTMTTNDDIRGVRRHAWPPFSGRFWQRNYDEHVIRNDRALDHLRAYIASNPARWQTDALHPDTPSRW